jgi:hypothetical protein
MSLAGDVAQVVVPALAGVAGAWWGGRMTLRVSRQAAERADRERHERELGDKVAAARMVHDELVNAASILDSALRRNFWDLRQIPLVASQAHAGALARTLASGQWVLVSRGIAAARKYARDAQLIMEENLRLEQQQQAATTSTELSGSRFGPTPTPIPFNRDVVEQWRREVSDAIGVLLPFARMNVSGVAQSQSTARRTLRDRWSAWINSFEIAGAPESIRSDHDSRAGKTHS